MPKPFLYDTSFINGNPNSAMTGTDLFHNIQCQRSMLWEIEKEYSITITDYAKAGIISGGLLAGGGNPARVRNDLVYYVTGQGRVYFTTYGLFQWTTASVPSDDGVADMDRLGADIYNTTHYQPTSDFPVSLSDYISSASANNLLGIIWLSNYTFANRTHPSEIFENITYIDQCKTLYTQILDIIENFPLPLNPPAIAIFKKRKKRWWK